MCEPARASDGSSGGAAAVEIRETGGLIMGSARERRRDTTHCVRCAKRTEARSKHIFLWYQASPHSASRHLTARAGVALTRAFR